MTLALICARAGSQGLVGKNFRYMLGKPLIRWSIDVALDCPPINSVAIVTDSDYTFGYLPVFREPAQLAAGDVGKWDVWRWAANEWEKRYSPAVIDTIVDIDITRPIRTPDDIEKVIKRFFAPPPDSHLVMGVTRAKKSPYFDLLEHDGKGRLHLSKPHPFTVRQSILPVWEHAGVYVIDRKALKSHDGLFSDGLVVHGQRLPTVCGLDIDDEMDWQIVEAILSRRILTDENLLAVQRGGVFV